MILSFSDAKTLGTFQSVSAIGMLISSLVIGIFTMTRKYANMLVLGLILSGLSFSLLGFSTNIYFIIFAGFLFLASLPFVNTSADVLVRKNIPNDKQGGYGALSVSCPRSALLSRTAWPDFWRTMYLTHY